MNGTQAKSNATNKPFTSCLKTDSDCTKLASITSVATIS